MANVIIDDTNLTNIANAIRGKNGTQNTYLPSQMATAITNIPSGGSHPWADSILNNKVGAINSSGDTIYAYGSRDITVLKTTGVNNTNYFWYSNADYSDIGDSIFNHMSYIQYTKPSGVTYYYAYRIGNYIGTNTTGITPTSLSNGINFIMEYNDTSNWVSDPATLIPSDISQSFTPKVTAVNKNGIIIGVWSYYLGFKTALQQKTLDLTNGVAFFGNWLDISTDSSAGGTIATLS